jgi:hypothetical protein
VLDISGAPRIPASDDSFGQGARVHVLPPDSYDYHPIERAWALLKTRIRTCAR